MDFVVGHGESLGRQAAFIRKHHPCNWIQVVHSLTEAFGPQELSMELSMELSLCEKADQVVAIGPELAELFRRYFRMRKGEGNVFDLTPSIFSEFWDVEQAAEVRRTFLVLVTGSGDSQYFSSAGYDLAARAIAELNDRSYQLMIVDAPRENVDEIAHKFFQCGVAPSQLIVRSFNNSRELLAELFFEVDLAILPSRTSFQGFGLLALKALSAGLPVLVSDNSGFGKALKRVPFGSLCVINSHDPSDWAREIRAVRQKNRALRLEEAKFLRKIYHETYNWQMCIGSLVSRVCHPASGDSINLEASIPSAASLREHTQADSPSSDSSNPEASIPTVALFRALEFGKICDKRVKVSIIGPDRVGKTSLGKSLRGEPFNPKEPSTDGVEMSLPIKNAGTKPWKNSDSHQHTTAFDHKCAEVIVKEEQAISTEQQLPSEAENRYLESGGEKIVEEELNRSVEQKRQATQIDTPVFVTEGKQASNEAVAKSLRGEDLIKSRSKEIAALMEDECNGGEGVWPVIWDFAGQAVYHAIHPLFMSPEDIYLLVIDLTKAISDLAQSFVKVDGHDEERASSPECEDTNLDSIIRWLTLVHSIKEQYGKSTSRSVILVGTKADEVKGDPNEKMKSLVKTLYRHCPRILLDHVANEEDEFVVDNTKAGTVSDEENQTIARLRDFILKKAKEMPHTKEEKPLQWLSAELEIKEIVMQRGPYVSRRTFKRDVVEKCCTRSTDDDVEGLLRFLHARGTIVYHTPPEDPDGLVVLDPVWLVETITKIITATPSWRYPPHHQCLYDRLMDTGILSKELLDFAFEQLDISAIKQSFIFIMKKFNLLFEWKSKDDGLTYIVPCMLSRRWKVDVDAALGPSPLCLRFDGSNYVPFGLFPRLVGLFGMWASEQCTAEQPDLSCNAASFFIDEKCQLRLVCFSSLITLYVCIEDTCNQDETISFCVSILRELKEFLVKLKGECHWLGSVLLKYYVRCELCSTSGSLPCARHSKRECSHDDCAHQIDLEKKPLVCRKNPLCWLSKSFKEKCRPWIKALEVINRKETPSATSESQESSAKRKGTYPSGSTSKRSKDDIMTSETAEAAVKDGVPDEGVLEELAVEIPGEWKMLGRRLLKNPEATLEAIDIEKRQCREKAYKMLLEWKRAKGSNATYRVLYDALCGAKRKDLAEKFCLSFHDSCAN